MGDRSTVENGHVLGKFHVENSLDLQGSNRACTEDLGWEPVPYAPVAPVSWEDFWENPAFKNMSHFSILWTDCQIYF